MAGIMSSAQKLGIQVEFPPPSGMSYVLLQMYALVPLACLRFCLGHDLTMHMGFAGL